MAGVAGGLPALRRLVPPGTLTARPGLPATILSRGLLTFAFFGADAYVTLAITAVRHRSPVVAGIAVTGTTLGWTAGAWVQARLSESWEGRRFERTGLVIILAGIGGMVLVLQPGVPVAVGLVAWTVAGLGMGLAYAPLSLMMLRKAPPGGEGQASASLNLTDVLGTAIGIGVGGAAVAAGAGGNLQLGITAAFGAAAAVGVVALVITRRLPPGTTASPPPAAQPVPARVPDQEGRRSAGSRPRARLGVTGQDLLRRGGAVHVPGRGRGRPHHHGQVTGPGEHAGPHGDGRRRLDGQRPAGGDAAAARRSGLAHEGSFPRW